MNIPFCFIVNYRDCVTFHMPASFSYPPGSWSLLAQEALSQSHKRTMLNGSWYSVQKRLLTVAETG